MPQPPINEEILADFFFFFFLKHSVVEVFNVQIATGYKNPCYIAITNLYNVKSQSFRGVLNDDDQ